MRLTVARKAGVIVALIACVWVAPATSSAGESRFRLAGTLPGESAPDVSCQGLHVIHEGPLHGSPLAEAHWSSTECVDLVARPGGVTVRDGRFTLDDGLIVGTFSAMGGLPDSSGNVYVWGSFSIEGGHGMYAGSTGGGVLTAVANVNTGAVQIELSGELIQATEWERQDRSPGAGRGRSNEKRSRA